MPLIRFIGFSILAVSVHNNNLILAAFEYDRQIIKDGRIQLSDKPGLGFELNEDEVRSRLLPDEEWWG